jgi:NAD(P)-dependent dehydrogenase (short-subunit alcohol dehydrogenase family)
MAFRSRREWRVPADVENAFAEVDAELGPATLAVACAGTAGALGPLHEADPDAWWRAVEVDLRGIMVTARSAVGRIMERRADRSIVAYGNLGDRLGVYVSAFAAAKAGVARLTEVLAGEVEDSGVRVFGIHPGLVRTPLTARLAWGVEGKKWLPRFGIGSRTGGGTAGPRPTWSRRSRSAPPTPCPAESCTSGS